MTLPIHVNSISDGTSTYTFWDMVGTIFIAQQKVEILDRNGVSGLGFRLCGNQGIPFTLKTITYHDSESEADTAYAAYTTLTASGLVTITRRDIGIEGFKVLQVSEAIPPQVVFNVAGSPGSQCRAEVLWKLIHAVP